MTLYVTVSNIQANRNAYLVPQLLKQDNHKDSTLQYKVTIVDAKTPLLPNTRSIRNARQFVGFVPKDETLAPLVNMTRMRQQ